MFGDVTIAERDEYRVRASVSGPLTGTLEARLTGFFSDVGGHIRNVANGEFINGIKSYGARGQLEWEPSDALSVLLIGDYRKSESTCCQYQSRSIGNPVFLARIAPVVPGIENDEVNINGRVGGGTEQYGVSLQGAFDLGPATVTSITAYRTWDFSNNQDVDGTNNPIPFLGLTQIDLNGGTTDIRQFSQEVRLDSNGRNTIDYTGRASIISVLRSTVISPAGLVRASRRRCRRSIRISACRRVRSAVRPCSPPSTSRRTSKMCTMPPSAS
jgi:iron complex outermembrane receptor protein